MHVQQVTYANLLRVLHMNVQQNKDWKLLQAAWTTKESISMIMQSFICRQVNENVNINFQWAWSEESFLILGVTSCLKYVQSNGNRPGRVQKIREPVVSMSGSETESVGSANSAREMVLIPKESFLEMAEKLKILSQRK